MNVLSKSIFHLATGNYLATNLRHADTFLSRLAGLLALPRMQHGDGLLITPCQQIHTHFMRYPIDALFLDKELRVIQVVSAIRPWRMTRFVKGAHCVLELPANVCQAINPGDQLQLRQ